MNDDLPRTGHTAVRIQVRMLGQWQRRTFKTCLDTSRRPRILFCNESNDVNQVDDRLIKPNNA